jgi:hypothetical protein
MGTGFHQAGAEDVTKRAIIVNGWEGDTLISKTLVRQVKIKVDWTKRAYEIAKDLGWDPNSMADINRIMGIKTFLGI